MQSLITLHLVTTSLAALALWGDGLSGPRAAVCPQLCAAAPYLFIVIVFTVVEIGLSGYVLATRACPKHAGRRSRAVLLLGGVALATAVATFALDPHFEAVYPCLFDWKALSWLPQQAALVNLGMFVNPLLIPVHLLVWVFLLIFGCKECPAAAQRTSEAPPGEVSRRCGHGRCCVFKALACAAKVCLVSSAHLRCPET